MLIKYKDFYETMKDDLKRSVTEMTIPVSIMNEYILYY